MLKSSHVEFNIGAFFVSWRYKKKIAKNLIKTVAKH